MPNISAHSHVDGKWNIVVDTPTGKTESVLDLATEGTALTGTSTSDDTVLDIEDGRIEDGRLVFSVKIRKPMPIRLKFNIGVLGDELDGEVKVGIFGKSKVVGARL
jgi:hypothetical protein